MNNTTETPGLCALISSDNVEFVKKMNQSKTVLGIYFVIFLSALLSNVVMIVIVFKDRYMKNVTNYFLVNLSVADLLVTVICMPNAAWSAYTDAYTFGNWSCKISAYLQGISVAMSIFTISTMAIDRYFAIIKPFGLRFRCFNRTTTIIMICVLWVLSLILFSPMLWLAGTTPICPDYDFYLCRMQYSTSPIPQEVIGVVWFVFMFAIPGCIMTVAYGLMGRTLCSSPPLIDANGSACANQRNRIVKSRKRVACILLLLALVFAGCWLPYHILTLLTILNNHFNEQLNLIEKYLLLLGHANSVLNPIIYCALSRNFRNSIRNLMTFEVTCVRRRNSANNANYAAESSNSGFQLQLNQAVPIQKHNEEINQRPSSQKTTKTTV